MPNLGSRFRSETVANEIEDCDGKSWVTFKAAIELDEIVRSVFGTRQS